MKAKIWKKVSQRVRILENDNGMFEVQAREKLLFKGFTEWQMLNQFSTLKKALVRKHMYITMIVMRELGLRNDLVKRRTSRRNFR